ncbi:MAG: hypothetical protein JRJ47_08750 [Deltaproteobacteria bacterium]|nr:hypothetical protein [Deltaproteobacteria bacterium]MBW1896596.1 hypothetical protein [Deltaproteobacteria bacterium]
MKKIMYEKPILISLTNKDAVRGACNPGTAPGESSCHTGNGAAANCHDGNSAGGICNPGVGGR